MKRIRAVSFGLGAIFLWAPQAEAQNNSERDMATLVVRVDDRKAHDLTQPWVSLIYPDGTLMDALALDDGSDPEDGIGGDHLYVCRMKVPPGEGVDVWVLDSGPVDSGILVHESRVNLVAGRTQRVTMRPGGASPGSATSVRQSDERVSVSGVSNPTGQEAPAPADAQPEPEEPRVDPSLGFAREATITPAIPNFRRWRSRDVWGLIGLFLFGWAGLRLGRRTRSRVIRQIEDSTSLIDALVCSPHSRPKP